MSSWKQLLLRWPMQWLGAGLLAMGLWMVLYTYQSSERVVRQYATDSAAAHAASITQFRNFYAQELVPLAVQGGMEITHDYKQREKALPLPATLAIDLGHYLSKVDGGTQVRLYSAQPFPWRLADQQLDSFQQQALQHLKARPDEPFVREEIMHGVRVLRFAQADRMLPKCVSCHNSYPGSPRTNWKEGDVRGALEVILPVSQWQLASTEVLNRTFSILLALLMGGLLMIWYSVRRLRGALMKARQLSADRHQAIGQLSGEITERKSVERDLRLSESKLNSIFQSVPEAIVVADAQGRIVQCKAANSTSDCLDSSVPILAPLGIAAATDVMLIRQLQNVVDALQPAGSAAGPLGAIQGATGGMMVTVQGWLDSLLPGNPAEAALWSIPLVITSLALLRMVSSFSADYGSAWLTSRVQANMREAMFARLLRLPNKYYDQTSTGATLSNFQGS
eukprot:gene12708-14681_t